METNTKKQYQKEHYKRIKLAEELEKKRSVKTLFLICHDGNVTQSKCCTTVVNSSEGRIKLLIIRTIFVLICWEQQIG